MNLRERIRSRRRERAEHLVVADGRRSADMVRVGIGFQKEDGRVNLVLMTADREQSIAFPIHDLDLFIQRVNALKDWAE